MNKKTRDKDDISYDIVTTAKDKLINNYNRTHKIYKYLVEFENCIINSVLDKCATKIEKETYTENREEYSLVEHIVNEIRKFK